MCLYGGQIAENAGKHGNFVVSKCEDREFGYGFNADTLTYGVREGGRPLTIDLCRGVAHAWLPACLPGVAVVVLLQDMFACGVLDSATVVENSIQNSVSVASLVLTSGVSE